MWQRRFIVDRHRIDMHGTGLDPLRKFQRAEMRGREYGHGEAVGGLCDQVHGVGFRRCGDDAEDGTERFSVVELHGGG